MFKYIFYPLMTWIREAVFDMDTCGAFLSKIQGKSLSRLDATFMVTVPKNSSILYIMSEHALIISINILYSKMCSICGGDFRNQFSVFGLYVMPTHG